MHTLKKLIQKILQKIIEVSFLSSQLSSVFMNISILISPIDAHNLIEVVSPFKFMHPQLPHPLMPPCCCLTKITMQYHYSSCCEAGREKKALSKPFFFSNYDFFLLFPNSSYLSLPISCEILVQHKKGNFLNGISSQSTNWMLLKWWEE